MRRELGLRVHRFRRSRALETRPPRFRYVFPQGRSHGVGAMEDASVRCGACATREVSRISGAVRGPYSPVSSSLCPSARPFIAELELIELNGVAHSMRSVTAAMFVDIAYGMEARREDDEFIAVSERALRGLEKCNNTGIIDIFPWGEYAIMPFQSFCCELYLLVPAPGRGVCGMVMSWQFNTFRVGSPVCVGSEVSMF